MKAKNKKQSKRQRVHSSLDKLPLWLCETLTKMLMHNEWPVDYSDHWDGAPRYVDLVEYCKKKKYTISLSAIGRFAKRMRTLSNKKPDIAGRAERVRDLARIAIAKVTTEYSDIVIELQDYLVNPERNQSPKPEIRIPFLRHLADGQLSFIKQAIEDVQSLEAGGSLVSTESIKRSSGQSDAK